jgi:HPt (histidine-containing phosphotransfer) domain-containing protein
MMMVSFCVLQTSTAHPGRRGDHRQFLTTHGTLPRGVREQCTDAGMDDYLTKPVEPARLAELLEKWLPKEASEPRSKNAESKQREPEASHDQTLLSFERTTLLRRLGGDEKLAEMILQAFLEDTPRQIEAIRRYLKSGDAAGAEIKAHAIKGASATVGAEALRALALELEKACNTGELDAALKQIPELEAQFALLHKNVVCGG